MYADRFHIQFQCAVVNPSSLFLPILLGGGLVTSWLSLDPDPFSPGWRVWGPDYSWLLHKWPTWFQLVCLLMTGAISKTFFGSSFFASNKCMYTNNNLSLISTLWQPLVIGQPPSIVDGDGELATTGARGNCISGTCHFLHVSVRSKGGRGGEEERDDGVSTENEVCLFTPLLWAYDYDIMSWSHSTSFSYWVLNCPSPQIVIFIGCFVCLVTGK